MTEKRKLKERLLRLIKRFSGKRVILIGDLIADQFVETMTERISREAPVPILRYLSSRIAPGGGGNAAGNIASLGGEVIPIGVVGEDEAGERLISSFKERGINPTSIIIEPRHQTPVKTRILAGGFHTVKQQVLRIDRWQPLSDLPGLRDRLAERLLTNIAEAKAILISDYGLGILSPSFFSLIKREARKKKIPFTLDSRYNLLDYPGATAVTPNEPEAEQALGINFEKDDSRIIEAGEKLLDLMKETEAVLITRGRKGMVLFERGREPVKIDIYGTEEIADVTGAGDTVIASFTLALSCGASFYEAARIANYAGGIVVMKRGTATVSQEELIDAVKRDSG
jgi:rfaE bifunctional protein kinase chain/domain